MRTDISHFVRRMAEIERRNAFALEVYSRSAGNKMVAFAKRNRPWQDRTRAAKDGITSSVQWVMPTRLRINLHSQRDYGVYLELVNFAHKGRLSIWWPTVQRFKPQILQGWADSINK